ARIGGELTHDEMTIIAGALQLTQKTTTNAMTPISDTFAVDMIVKLDRGLMKLVLEKGYSRVPVYYDQPTNLIGLILVKNLLNTHPADEVPVKSVTIRKIPRVHEILSLYDILNEFQKGHSHIVVVIRTNGAPAEQQESKTAVDGGMVGKRSYEGCATSNIYLANDQSLNGKVSQTALTIHIRELPGQGVRSGTGIFCKLMSDEYPLLKLAEEDEAVGIITIEDVTEELSQEEIFDETDNPTRIRNIDYPFL
ncbi:hypothetical protein GIB67_016323, partial [Kingdonia uniflora]